MNRRRMMLQQSKPDLLEGYRVNNNSTYKVSANWIDNNTVELKHTGSGFMGPNVVAVNFIGTTNTQSTGYSGAIEKTPAMNTLELGKNYCLTLTVTEIVKNTATTENDGVLTLAFGRGGGSGTAYSATTSVNFSELTVGSKLEVVKSYAYSNYATTGAAFQVTNAGLQWDIKFKVELEEV